MSRNFSSQSVNDILDKDYQRTPDPSRIAGSRTQGRRSKLGVMEFWYALFELNELRPKDKKLTNAEIARQMVAEFPDRENIQRLLDDPTLVNSFRFRYNTGDLLSYRPGRPKHISFRYNEDGERINSRTGQPMTAEQMHAYINHYTTYTPKKRGPSTKSSDAKKKRRSKKPSIRTSD